MSHDPVPGLTSWQIQAWVIANNLPNGTVPKTQAQRAAASGYPATRSEYTQWENKNMPRPTTDPAGGAKHSDAGHGGSGGDLMSLIHEAGFQGQAARIMYGIVMAESGGNATAHNTNASTGDNSYGLAQINMLGSMGPARLREYGLKSNNDLFDPLTNLKVAYKMSGHGSHWGDWSTYNSGAYLQFTNQTGAQVSSSGSGGGSSGGVGGGGSGGGGSMSDFRNVDGLGRLLQQVPALSRLVDQAVSGNWTTEEFQNAVEDSKWYKRHSATARAVLIQQANDPSSYQQSLQNTLGSLSTLSHQLGMTLNAKELQAIATHALLTGNDGNQQWLTEQIGRRQDYSNLTDLGGLSGGMANTAQQLQGLAADYGYTWSASDVAQRAQQILVGNQTIDTYKQRLISWAKSAFPSLAKELDAGTTVKDLADPYVQSMSQLLEVDPATLNTYTPMIRKALQGQRDKPDADPTTIPLWKFEEQVRNDPRWQFTQNARDSMSSALVRVGQDFGFGI